jgi:hypothetical protein
LAHESYAPAVRLVAAWDSSRIQLTSPRRDASDFPRTRFALPRRGAPVSRCDTVDFQTGQATLEDLFNDRVVDIALPLSQN